jgi:hypothetical protein
MNGTNIMVMKENKTTVVRTEIPDGLLTQAQDLVAAGWFRNLDDLMLDRTMQKCGSQAVTREKIVILA